MPKLLNALREHRHFFIVVILLTLVVTFPTIIYVFKTDVFWHPAGDHRDVPFWDIWYGKQFLTGQASALYTNQLFYPEGVSLRFHLFFIPLIIVVNALSILLPVSNAYSLAYLLIIFLCAFTSYVYLSWLFKDKWIAVLGAVVFGLSPHVVGHPFQPQIACIATIPLALYCIHRGTKENRRVLVILAGLLAGLTTVVVMYMYICLLIMLGFITIALAISRWRDKGFWLNVALLVMTISLASSWRVYPMLTSSESIGEAVSWHGDEEIATDVISYFVNHSNPLHDRFLEPILQVNTYGRLSNTSFLGYLPLLLTCIGLLTTMTRRKMAPWAFLCAFFLILRLGSQLHINGVDYSNILLPKHYLNQLLPVIFASFWEADFFMMGALLPFAVLVCYGLVAYRQRFPIAKRPVFILAAVVIVALEYHIPVQTDRIFAEGDGTISKERLAFLDWLDKEDEEIRLINLPFGRRNAKIYGFYQSLSGFPHAEGAISRTPDSAFNYIRANLLLNTWYMKQPISCEWVDQDAYLTGLAQLEEDGFSHVVYHLGFKYAEAIKESFRRVEPSYADKYVWIFHLKDLRDSCNGELNPHSSFTDAYASALQEPSSIDERHGTVVVFPPTVPENEHFMRYLRHFSRIKRDVMTITTDEMANVTIQRPAQDDIDPAIELERFAAIWLLNSPQDFDAEQTPAYLGWFKQRFHFCRRFYEDERSTIDAYLRVDIPCSAIDQSSEMEVQYDVDMRLHNISYDVDRAMLRFFLAWTNTSTDNYAFSLQFFDEAGQKVLQDDKVIYRDLLAIHDIDASTLTAGVYSIQLIVYDFETQVGLGGTLIASGQRFERELEIAKIEL